MKAMTSIMKKLAFFMLILAACICPTIQAHTRTGFYFGVGSPGYYYGPWGYPYGMGYGPYYYRPIIGWPYYGYSYYRPYYGYHAPYRREYVYERSYADDRGKEYWSMTNNTQDSMFISPLHGGQGYKVYPGQTAHVQRGSSFQFRIHIPNKSSRIFKSNAHKIVISMDKSGALAITQD